MMTPNETLLQKLKAQADKMDIEYDRVIQSQNEVLNKLGRQSDKLYNQITELEETVRCEKLEVKLLAILQAGKKGVFDKRFSHFRAIKRYPHTYWYNKNTSSYAARAASQDVKQFFKKDHDYNAADAKYYAIHGKFKPAPKKSQKVDIGALNRALIHSGYKVVSR